MLIQETKMSSANFNKIVSHVWPGATYMHMDAEGASGGIATMWNLYSMMGVEVWKDRNFIIIDFQTSIQHWGLINIYASNNNVGRKETYDKLARILETMKDKKLMCMGDFNTPLYHSKKLGGNRDYPESLQDLNDFIRRMDFIDVELRGNPFTWTNNRKGRDLIQVRLDRLMVTGNWN